MNYNIIAADIPRFYSYQRNIYEQRYFMPDIYNHQEALSNECYKPFQPVKFREYYYRPSVRAKIQKQAYISHKKDFMDWAKLLYPIIIQNTNNANVRPIQKPHTGTFELMELKTDGCFHEFLIRDNKSYNIATWYYLPADVKKIKKYFNKHPFPKDALYTEQMFWKDYENKRGYISLVVEKSETAEYILHLCCALIYKPQPLNGRVK